MMMRIYAVHILNVMLTHPYKLWLVWLEFGNNLQIVQLKYQFIKPVMMRIYAVHILTVLLTDHYTEATVKHPQFSSSVNIDCYTYYFK